MTGPDSWLRRSRVGTAESLCSSWPAIGEQSQRIYAACRPTDTALVLGSAQPAETAFAGIGSTKAVQVVRRPAGGGAVFVAPDAQIWAEFWVPRDDGLWEEDVVRSSLWLGRAWAAALESIGVTDAKVHEGRAVTTRWSAVACFAGLGPGEVTVRGKKVLGIAQRRTRAGARFLSVVPVTLDAVGLVELLQLDGGKADDAAADIGSGAVGLIDVLPASRRNAGAQLVESLEQALGRSLP